MLVDQEEITASCIRFGCPVRTYEGAAYKNYMDSMNAVESTAPESVCPSDFQPLLDIRVYYCRLGAHWACIS